MMKQMKKLAISMAVALIFTANLSTPFQSKAATNVVRVTSSLELFQAMKNANPGDEIVIAEGNYEGKLGSSASGHGSSFFNSDRDGTTEQPIILRSENPNNKTVLSGSRMSGNVLRITGDYWVIKDLKVTNAQKGIMLDNSNYSEIINCEVYNVGMEGIHLRDNSSYNTVDGCVVTDTGLQTPAYGEGIYVGTAKSSWSTYGEQCHYNVIKNCTLGPNITAEHVDIKEGTIGTVVENCIMDGTGISGQNYADSFIDAKGNDAIIRGNTCYRNNNEIILDAFQVHNQLPGWGLNNCFCYNTVHMDNTTGYVVSAANNTTASACNNLRVPTGNMYSGQVTICEGDDTLPIPEEPEKPVDPVDPVIPDEPDPKEPENPENPILEDTYDNSAVYVSGDTVIYQGKTFKAKWWTQGTAPSLENNWGPWELVE